MTCDECKREFNYCFYIDDEYWFKATDGKREGHLCANCVLEKNGGLDWYIIWNEASQKITSNLLTNNT